MTRFRLCACGALALAVGCKKDATFTEPLPNYAHVTFLNALSDTMQLDTRVIDMATSYSGFMDFDFRNGQFFPLNMDPGDRHFKVFLSSTVDTIASKVLLDTTLTFAEGQDYSLYLAGRARGGGPGVRAVFSSISGVTPGAGQIALRVMNLAPALAGTLVAIPDTAAAPDVFILSPTQIATGTTAAATSLAFGASSQYMVLDTGTYRIALTAPGAPAANTVLATVPVGALAAGGSSAVAGSRVPGSIITAVIVPRSVPGSMAPQTRAGQGASQATDTSVSEASRRITLSGDTVTVQVGSITQLTNRRSATGARLADSTIRRTGTGAASPALQGSSILVAGANEAEYNGWQGVMAIVDTLICAVADPGDVVTGSTKHCAPPADTTVASADTATTRFRFRYRIVGAPASPGSGTVTYRIGPPTNAATDFVTPQVIFMIDKRP
jgi:hypothetical protein